LQKYALLTMKMGNLTLQVLTEQIDKQILRLYHFGAMNKQILKLLKLPNTPLGCTLYLKKDVIHLFYKSVSGSLRRSPKGK